MTRIVHQPILINARYVVPVRPQRVVLEHHSVLVDGDVISDVLSTAEAASRYPDCKQVDLTRHVLFPGLINMHTHSPMTLLRGIADDLDLQVWLNQHIILVSSIVILLQVQVLQSQVYLLKSGLLYARYLYLIQ